MRLSVVKISILVITMMLFQKGNGMNIGEVVNMSNVAGVGMLRKINHPRVAEWEERCSRVRTYSYASIAFDIRCGAVDLRTLCPEYANMYKRETQRRKEEAQIRIQELSSLGGDASRLSNWANGAPTVEEIPQYFGLIWEIDEEIDRLRKEAEQRKQQEEERARQETARLKKEAEQRRQQEEARARQEAEQRRQEEEARAKREAELLKQQEEIRSRQEAEVQLRMQELKDLGGNPEILSKFEKGSGNPEELQEYKATLNRADAEIARLRKEDGLNKQSMIDQLTEEVESQKEENRELRSMIEQLMEEVKNLKMMK